MTKIKTSVVENPGKVIYQTCCVSWQKRNNISWSGAHTGTISVTTITGFRPILADVTTGSP